MKKKQNVIVVCGPTATGKSDYSVELAKEINGEIISADSRQVYKGLNLGSGKINQTEMGNIKHYLLDVASPKRVFTVSEYEKHAKKAIQTILNKNKTPIICGGSGYYIETLLFGNLPNVKPNLLLRQKLEKKSTSELYNILRKKDSVRAKNIDTKNKVRLIRALEIVEEIGKVPKIERKSPYEITWIYLDFPDEVLKERIHKRLLKRIKEGMVEEVKDLVKNGVTFKRLHALGLEYRYIGLYLEKKITKKVMIESLEKAIWQYVKRQRTWFKKYGK